MAARRRRARSATTSRALADHGLAGLGLRHRLRARRRCPTALVEAAAERGFPLFEVPTSCRSSRSPRRRSRAWSTSSTRVLQRAIAAHERLQRIVLSERGLDGDRRGAGRARSAAPALDLRRARRRAAGAARFRRGARRRRVAALRRRAARARAAAATRRGFAPGAARARRPRARAAGRAHAAHGAASRALPQAWLVAAKDAGALTEIDRLDRCTRPSPSSRSSCCAAASPTTTERRLAGDVLTALVAGELDGRRARAPAGAVRARRAASARSSCAPPRARQAPTRRGGAGRRAARRGRRRPRRPAPARSSARCCPAAAPTTSCSSSPSASARACRARGRRRARRRAPGRAVAGGRAARAAFHEARCALEARALGRGDEQRQRRRRPRARCSRPTATSAPSSCCSRCRTTTRCGCSATRSSSPIEDGEGALRRRADALARGLHRVQRPVGARRAAAVLPPPHAALPDPHASRS